MHHGITQLFDAGELPDALFMATEYVDGATLAESLDKGLDWDLPARASVVMQMLDAIDYACQLGVPHLNLKPTNVVLGPAHAVKVGGFGVGAFLSKLGTASSRPMIVSSRYAAPERLRGEPGDQRTDVYSAAQIARDVFIGRDPAAAIPEALLADGISAEAMLAVFARALSANPRIGSRHQTC